LLIEVEGKEPLPEQPADFAAKKNRRPTTNPAKPRSLPHLIEPVSRYGAEEQFERPDIRQSSTWLEWYIARATHHETAIMTTGGQQTKQCHAAVWRFFFCHVRL
jgi:hypothetical protein